MPSIILSDNGASSGSAGIKTTGGNDGVLQLQTTTSGGTATTAVSISNTQVVTVTNDASVNGLTVGRGAGSVSTNTAVGASALQANTSGSQNTSVGQNSLYTNTTGAALTAVGQAALYANTTGSENTAVGTSAAAYPALRFNTTGSNNVAVGGGALSSNTTGSNNTASGYQAGYNATTSSYSVFLGSRTAANGASNITGNYHTLVGDAAGFVLQGASTNNAFFGQNSGSAVTTGSKNTIIGSYTGNQGGLDIRTGNNYIVLSDGDGNPRMWTDGSAGGRPWFNYGGTSRSVFNNTASGVAVGLYVWYSNSAPNNTGSEFLYCDDSSATRLTIRSNGGIANFSANNVNLSDRREKTNFAPAKSYLDVICAIPVQTFNYIDQNLEEDDGLTLGVVAQDVQAVAPELVMESNWAKEGDEPRMRLSIYQTDLQYALMKAIQELKAELDTAKAEIAALKGTQP